jgi:membrane protein implicated in regulation of membrane protease activity
MLRIFIRSTMVFAFSMFGKKVIALGGAALLLFVTALLIDFHLYISAGLAGTLSFVALVAFVVQYFRQKRAERERQEREAEEATRRAAAAQTRSEKMQKAKATVSDTVKGMATGAAGMVDTAKVGMTNARNRVDGWRK